MNPGMPKQRKGTPSGRRGPNAAALAIIAAGSLPAVLGIPLRQTDGYLSEPDVPAYTGGHDPDQAAERLRESMERSRASVRGYIPADEVAATLERAGVKAVLIGGPAIGCHTGIARASQDVDFIVPGAVFRTACSTVKAAYRSLRESKGNGYSRFRETGTQGPIERIDLLRADSPMMEKTLEHALKIMVGKTGIHIPDADHLVALKFSAFTSDTRREEKRSYDHGDLRSLIRTCTLDDAYIAQLCDEMQAGYGALYLGMAQRMRG